MKFSESMFGPFKAIIVLVLVCPLVTHGGKGAKCKNPIVRKIRPSFINMNTINVVVPGMGESGWILH